MVYKINSRVLEKGALELVRLKLNKVESYMRNGNEATTVVGAISEYHETRKLVEGLLDKEDRKDCNSKLKVLIGDWSKMWRDLG